MTSKSGISAFFISLTFWAMPANAEEAHCKYYPKVDLLLDSYELIGPENCRAACTETEGCTAWSYTPHTFNPTGAPGRCRLMDDISEEVEDNRDYCGRVE